MTRWAAVVLGAVLLAGCGSASPARAGAPPASVPPAPSGDAAGAVVAALHADDALRAAYARADPGPLAVVFSGPALVTVGRDLAAMAARGARREEQVEDRQVVHRSLQGPDAEVVLQVRVRQRLLVDGSSPPFVAVVRQWRAHLRHAAAGWTVVETQELRPDQWWQPPA